MFATNKIIYEVIKYYNTKLDCIRISKGGFKLFLLGKQHIMLLDSD